ncbi:MAG: hypothetical protein AAGI03_04175 [Pseudomonadota bacterium]
MTKGTKVKIREVRIDVFRGTLVVEAPTGSTPFYYTDKPGEAEKNGFATRAGAMAKATEAARMAEAVLTVFPPEKRHLHPHRVAGEREAMRDASAINTTGTSICGPGDGSKSDKQSKTD